MIQSLIRGVLARREIQKKKTKILELFGLIDQGLSLKINKNVN